MQSAPENPYPRSRNPRACEACRLNKSRCFASEEPNICQRCLKSRLSCVVRSVARPRRVKKLTESIDEETTPQPSSGFTKVNTEAVYIKLNNVALPSTKTYASILNQHHAEVFKELVATDLETHLPLSPSQSINTPASRSNELTEPDEMTPKRNLTIHQAEEFLQSFHDFSHYFPFVIIPRDATVKSLSRHSPFLLLSILTAASSANMQLNCQLDHEFKRVLSEKIICEGRKNLDFLQGLLVYTAWFPCQLRAKNRQIFMYINLAVTLADDLGLGHRELPSLPLFPDSIETEGLFDVDGFSKAARRAYLGCYYLSSAVALGLQKPNTLRYSDLIDEYAASISKDAEIPTDASLLTLIKSHHIEEKLRDSLCIQAPSANNFCPSLFHLEMPVQAFHNEVEEWKRSMPSKIKELPHIVLGERFLNIIVFSNDLALFRHLQSVKDLPLNPIALSHCLEATISFFDALLSLSPKSFHGFTSPQWSHVVIAIVILSRLSFPLPRCPGWDAAAARERAPLGEFLDTLCSRLQVLSSSLSTDQNPKNFDRPSMFRVVLESIKRTYEQRLSLFPSRLPISVNTPEGNADTVEHSNLFSTMAAPINRLHCPMNDRNLMSFLEPFDFNGSDMANGAIPSVRPAVGVSSIPLYHDLWATMTMSWASD